MAAHDRVLGKAEAVLTVVEDRIASIQRLADQLEGYEQRLRVAMPDIESLRTIVPDIQDTVASLRTTQWMTSSQVARYIHVHPDTVRRWYRNGILPGYRVGEGDDIRFDRREVDRAMKRIDEDVEGRR